MNQGVAKYKGSYGFSFLELVVVICLIAILFTYSVVDYRKRIGESQREVFYFQANAFKRSIDNVRAISSLQGSSTVDLGTGVYVFVFSTGWPYAAGLSNEPPSESLSPYTCGSLWQYLFTNAIAQNDNSNTKGKYHFETHLIKNHICRYKQRGGQENPYFFDYDVRTGTVEISKG